SAWKAPLQTFFQPSPNVVRFAQISDGTSNTLAAAEKNLCLTTLGTGSDLNDDEGYTNGSDDDTVSFLTVKDINGNVIYQPAPDLRGNCTSGTGGFGSSHLGRFNALFADGSVHGINYSISLLALNAVCGINDGTPIGDIETLP